MVIYWDTKKRDDFIKYCIDCLNKVKGTDIHFIQCDTLNDRYFFYCQLGSGENKGLAQSVSIYYTNIIDIVKPTGDEIHLDDMDEHLKLEIGKLFITYIWRSMYYLL